MKKILYFYPVYSSFVQTDEKLLSEKYITRKFFFNALNKILTPYYFFTQLFFILRHCVSADKMISQFAGYHSFLPALAGRVFNRKHYIILHGTECNNFPEIKYGYLSRPLLFWFAHKSMQWSAQLFPVSETLVSARYTYIETKYPLQGYANFYKNIHTLHTVIHNGILIDRFDFDPGLARIENSFVTVATGLESDTRRIIKGLDLIILLAKMTPEYQYTFVGGQKPADLDLPLNINVLEFVPNDKLSAIYNQHQYYLQLSITEGFGISVGEAMLCGCVPIVSDVGILPLIASDNGYVLKKKNIDVLVELVKKAIGEYKSESQMMYRQHIINHYPLKLREQKLLRSIEDI